MKIRHSILGNKYIEATDEDVNPQQELADELHDTIEDDFDYVLAGIERLGRENKLSEAITIMKNISNTLNAAILDISDNFSDASTEE